MDIKQFFASVDHEILYGLITERIKDEDILWLIKQVVNSFVSDNGVSPRKGIPLGNLTSQIFANVYLNELDRFIKHNLKIKYYLRYADDFIILDQDQTYLYRCIDTLKQFLADRLKLELHSAKILIRKFSWGIDFCGYIVLPHYIIPRTKTRRRIYKKVLKDKVSPQSFQSYLGYFSHTDSYQVQNDFTNIYYLTA